MSVSYGKLVKDIKNVRLEMFILPATDHFTSIFIDSDEVFDAGDVGKLVKCGDFEGSYIMQIESPKHALISWHPDNYAQHQGVPCSLYEFKELEHQELVAMTLATGPTSTMNTDELCNTIEGLPDDAKLFRPNEPFSLNTPPHLSTGLTGADLKALVRERNEMQTVLNAVTAISVGEDEVIYAHPSNDGTWCFWDKGREVEITYPSVLEAFEAKGVSQPELEPLA